MSAGMPPSGMPSSLAAREDTGGAPAAAAPQRPPGSAGRVHAALMAHLPLAERLAGPQLCATLRPSALKPRAPGPADSLRSEARPWELEHMRALFPAAEVARRRRAPPREWNTTGATRALATALATSIANPASLPS